MSWQVRLGNLDQEIDTFLENNEDFPIKEKREFVKFAVRRTLLDLSDEYSSQRLQVEQMKELEEELRSDSS